MFTTATWCEMDLGELAARAQPGSNGASPAVEPELRLGRDEVKLKG